MSKEELERLEKSYIEYRQEYREWTMRRPPRWRFLKYKKWLKDEPKLKI